MLMLTFPPVRSKEWVDDLYVFYHIIPQFCCTIIWIVYIVLGFCFMCTLTVTRKRLYLHWQRVFPTSVILVLFLYFSVLFVSNLISYCILTCVIFQTIDYFKYYGFKSRLYYSINSRLLLWIILLPAPPNPNNFAAWPRNLLMILIY